MDSTTTRSASNAAATEARPPCCSRCRFWLQDQTTHNGPVEEGDIAFGFCRRNAPVVIGELAALCVPRQVWGRDSDREEDIWSTQLYRASSHPVSESGDWCGAFEPLPLGER